jgi:hypothetical protein
LWIIGYSFKTPNHFFSFKGNTRGANSGAVYPFEATKFTRGLSRVAQSLFVWVVFCRPLLLNLQNTTQKNKDWATVVDKTLPRQIKIEQQWSTKHYPDK